MPHMLRPQQLAQTARYRSGYCPKCRTWATVHVQRKLVRCPEGHIVTAIRDAPGDPERESTEQAVADVERRPRLRSLQLERFKTDQKLDFTPDTTVTTTIRRKFKAARTRCYR